ncbi:hypothetical protein D9M71_841780 [compost metagenome]
MEPERKLFAARAIDDLVFDAINVAGGEFLMIVFILERHRSYVRVIGVVGDCSTKQGAGQLVVGHAPLISALWINFKDRVDAYRRSFKLGHGAIKLRLRLGQRQALNFVEAR